MTFAKEMNPDLKQLLMIAGVSIPVGLVGGLLLRKLNPGFCKSDTKTCYHRKWWLFLLGLIFFAGMSVMSFYTSRPYQGAIFVAGAILQGFALVKYGFGRLTPELEEKINETDFTQILPSQNTSESNKANKSEMATPNPPSD